MDNTNKRRDNSRLLAFSEKVNRKRMKGVSLQKISANFLAF